MQVEAIDSHSRCNTEQSQPVFILEGKAPVESSRGDGGDGESGSLSPTSAALPLTHAETLAPWQSESLLAESWSTVGDADPEDTKSLDAMTTRGWAERRTTPPTLTWST
ncbi:hypothetical protein KUCAC02_006952 [Chaenocephalus aceratus]|uniref:Uncharacterized protein n=1 Tax=Chaenocephalus aceratus TaxID=36190 RepID=A0ACB9VTC9_CHAAC|nr:hypothetical protein KUCAC02_006952 [Chaenocephalus aceratus]